jgi:type 1 glutamine amidotransferase
MRSPRPFVRICLFVISALVVHSAQLSAAEADTIGPSRTRVLLVYGGHEFETNRFFDLFRDEASLDVKMVQHPDAQAYFGAAHAREYDVLVFYDMWQTISDEAKTNLIQRLNEGKGLVALHHCLASFQNWDEYARIIGGRYHLKPWSDQGEERKESTYVHGVDFRVRIADSHHPVTAGLQDFGIHDETYGGFEVSPQVHPLLTTSAPTSGYTIAWSKNYGAARVIYLQLGHDHQAWDNPNYRRFLRQAIGWTAHRTPID